jgi:hypothetical protein
MYEFETLGIIQNPKVRTGSGSDRVYRQRPAHRTAAGSAALRNPKYKI